MGKVAIVTDSTADLPREMYEEHGIVVVPLLVHFGDEIYRDGVDLSSEEFYDKLVSSKILPRTSQPSPHDFHHERPLPPSKGSAVILLTTAWGLSSSLTPYLPT